MEIETALGRNRPQGSRRSTPAFRTTVEASDAFQGLPEGVGRYDLLRLVKQVGPDMGFRPGIVAHLEYLINHTQDRDWSTPGERPIVYVGVETMAFDFGVDPKTIWNREQRLHQLGALTWRDKGNHGRCGQRCRRTGRILFAFGVDLSPLGQLYELLADRAAAMADEKAAWTHERRRVSSLRRVVKAYLAEAAQDPALANEVRANQALYDELAEQAADGRRSVLRMQQFAAGLQVLADRLRGVLDARDAAMDICAEDGETSCQEGKNSRPKYITTHPKSDESDNCNPMDHLRGRLGSRQDAGKLRANARTGKQKARQGEPERASRPIQGRKPPENGKIASGIEHLRLSVVLDIAGEDFRALLPDNGQSFEWSDLVEAAFRLCPMIGINEHAWAEAATVIGRNAAAVAVLLADRARTRPENPVSNPGGYLRGMTRAAETGELHLHRSVFGWLRNDGENA